MKLLVLGGTIFVGRQVVAEPEWAAFQTADVRRALAAGLRFRPLAATARKEADGALPPAGITRERERELLDGWRRGAA